jgi:hypothetical protein
MQHEIATGAEARSLRRWSGRAVAPRALRWLAVLALVVGAFIVYEEVRPWHLSDCEHWGVATYTKSDLPAGHHYIETSEGTFVPCLDPP